MVVKRPKMKIGLVLAALAIIAAMGAFVIHRLLTPPLFASHFGKGPEGILPAWQYAMPVEDSSGNELYCDFQRNIAVLLMFTKDSSVPAGEIIVRNRDVTGDRAVFTIGGRVIEVDVKDVGMLVVASDVGTSVKVPMGSLSARDMWHTARSLWHTSRSSGVGTKAGEWNMLTTLCNDPVIADVVTRIGPGRDTDRK